MSRRPYRRPPVQRQPCRRCGNNEWTARSDGRFDCRPCNRARCRAWAESHTDYQKEKARQWREDNPFRYMLTAARDRARKAGLPCTLTEADVVGAYPRNGNCPVLSVPLEVGRLVDRATAPSLDRIDPRKGYVPGNIAVISFRANQLKSDGTLEEHERLVEWMRRVTRKNPREDT